MRLLPLLLATLVLLPGCLDRDGKRDDAPASDVPLALRPVTSAPFTSYLHDVSQPIAGLSVENAVVEQYRTPVGELIELDTWIARPNVPGPVPLVLEVTPYYGGGDPRQSSAVIGGFGQVADVFVARGYAVGISSVRGTGNSGGCFTQGGPQEGYDTAAVIEHLAAQAWSNGNVGLMGVSYPGTTPQDAWVVAPEALKAIVPISGISDLYKYNFVNGVPINAQGFAFNTYYWAIVGAGPAGLAGGAQALDPAHVATAAAGEACTDQVEVQEGGASSAIDGDKDAYWQVRDFHAEAVADPQRPRPAVFYIHGLQDWNVKPHMMEDWLPMLQESGSPYKVWLGQWGHAWPQGGGKCLFDEDNDRGANCRGDWWNETIVAWFDQFLLGRDTGVLDGPRVQVQDDDGVWRHEQVWPAPDAAPRRFALGSGSLGAGDDRSSSYFDRFGGLVDVPMRGPAQAEWVSEPLRTALHLSGLPVFHANVTASESRASLVLSLQEQLPDGTRRSFNFCIQSLNHVASLQAGDDDIAGQRQEVEVQCFPQQDVLHAGSRLVLVAAGNIVGGPGPGIQPVTDGNTITIEHAGAWLELPVDPLSIAEEPQPYDAP